jgi:hypothetical protein
MMYAVEMGSGDMIHTKFHEDWYRCSSNIKVLPQYLKGCNVGITDGRDFCCMLMKWAQVT